MTRKGMIGIGPVVPTRCLPLVVLVGHEEPEVSRVAGLLGGIRSGRLVAYDKVEDVAQSPPRGRAALVVVAALQSCEGTRRALEAFKRRWPQAALALVGDAGAARQERWARVAGAMYFVSPIAPAQWQALLRDAAARSLGKTVTG